MTIISGNPFVAQPQSGHGPKPAAGNNDKQDDKFKLTMATMSGIYKSTVAAAVDSNHDNNISMDEYRSQAQGGDVAARYKKLDVDGDGKVSDDELANSIADPLSGDQAVDIQKVIDEIQAGQSIAKPSGVILNAQGQVADPHQMLRYLVSAFPGNVGR